jgi:hypothetical protein
MEYAGKERKGERVRESTSHDQNVEIDKDIFRNVVTYSGDRYVLEKRIKQLDEEWSIERLLETNMSALALTGLALGVFVNIYWLILPAVVLAFFVQHALQGWCPPLPIFRAFKRRTRAEIDREKFALKALRGDFAGAERDPDAAWNAVNK